MNYEIKIPTVPTVYPKVVDIAKIANWITSSDSLETVNELVDDCQDIFISEKVELPTKLNSSFFVQKNENQIASIKDICLLVIEARDQNCTEELMISLNNSENDKVPVKAELAVRIKKVMLDIDASDEYAQHIALESACDVNKGAPTRYTRPYHLQNHKYFLVF